ncbi:MAG: HAD-IA family hydrolase [Gammaproteobacteria bacterium]
MTSSPSPAIRTVLFDLDGTLADTAPDLGYALNYLLREQQRPPLPFERIRPVVSHGATALVRLGFGLDPNEPLFAALRDRLLSLYQQHLARETRLFAGMAEVLAYIETQDMNWGVVTNKPAFLTEPLIAALGLAARAACIVSGDTTANKKPHPEPLLHACRLAGSKAAQCLYIGDAERDVRAGHRAGMHTLVAMFGYIGDQDRPDCWGADALVNSPTDIIDWIAARSSRESGDNEQA